MGTKVGDLKARFEQSKLSPKESPKQSAASRLQSSSRKLNAPPVRTFSANSADSKSQLLPLRARQKSTRSVESSDGLSQRLIDGNNATNSDEENWVEDNANFHSSNNDFTSSSNINSNSKNTAVTNVDNEFEKFASPFGSTADEGDAPENAGQENLEASKAGAGNTADKDKGSKKKKKISVKVTAADLGLNKKMEDCDPEELEEAIKKWKSEQKKKQGGEEAEPQQTARDAKSTSGRSKARGTRTKKAQDNKKDSADQEQNESSRPAGGDDDRGRSRSLGRNRLLNGRARGNTGRDETKTDENEEDKPKESRSKSLGRPRPKPDPSGSSPGNDEYGAKVQDEATTGDKQDFLSMAPAKSMAGGTAAPTLKRVGREKPVGRGRTSERCGRSIPSRRATKSRGPTSRRGAEEEEEEEEEEEDEDNSFLPPVPTEIIVDPDYEVEPATVEERARPGVKRQVSDITDYELRRQLRSIGISDDQVIKLREMGLIIVERQEFELPEGGLSEL